MSCSANLKSAFRSSYSVLLTIQRTLHSRKQTKQHKISTSMTRYTTSIALLAMIASGSQAFTTSSTRQRSFMPTVLKSSTTESYYFAETMENSTVEPQQQQRAEIPPAPKPKKAVAKKAAPKHKDGIFSPLVKAAKVVLGDEKLNKVRAKAISMHSDVIASFVDTYESAFGTTALKTLFQMADKNQNGKLEEDELKTLFQSLGFDWLQEKQVKGIISRADPEEKGYMSLEDWMKEAPKTLRTNLTKLAKKNGGELGFLA